MNATDLAGASNAAVYASMSTLSVAMIAFAISFARAGAEPNRRKPNCRYLPRSGAPRC